MLLGLQNSILRMVAQGDDLGATLVKLCSEVELLLPGTYASILTLDSQCQLHPAAAPSLPAGYSAALNGLVIGAGVGSCGSAAFLQQAVTVTDIEHDLRWADFKALALPLGLKACFSSPIFGSKGRVLGTFALYFREPRSPSPLEQSIVEGCLPLCMIALERYERLLEHRRLAFTDVLTGLPNRAKFNDTLEKITRQQSWALLLVDVDDLKTVNDTFGHAAGDDLIAAVALALSRAAARLPVYRLGGDEFAIVIDRATKEDAERLAIKVATEIRRPVICAGHTVNPSVTVGVAHSREQLSSADVRHHADIALYHAKEEKRGSFAVFDSALRSTIAKRTETIHAVAAALKEDRVEAWYQPIVRIDTGEIVGLEALARMRLADGTVVPAGLFHEATKDVFVAASLTRQMIACIARDVGQWLSLNIPLQHVGINVSAADFSSDELPAILVHAFERENVPLHHAILEVTESVYLGGKDQTVATKIAALRASGLKVALDDFGTGFASLTHLITVPIDIIKIDKSFIDRFAPDDVGTGIVEGILHIATRLGIRVVAEGIETLSQAEMLLERGCLLGQGYLYSKAIPATEMTALLQSRSQRLDSPAVVRKFPTRNTA